MESTMISLDGYQVETYHIHENLSFSMAFDLQNERLPANGGLRFCKYNSLKEQQEEALNLARVMSKKHRIYNTGFSGVKLVANGEVNFENKKRLLKAVAGVLNKHNGRVYTGCDLNINNDDMDILGEISPYVLNGIGSAVDTSVATAYGVYGSLAAVMSSEISLPNRTFLIHGLGKIGSVIAQKLIDEGHRVYTYDICPESADLEGAINISNQEDWYKIPCDYLVLCSKSGVINYENVHEIQCRWIVSSANAPFSSDEIMPILQSRGVQWIPDAISNAGAVICDSLEYSNFDYYQKIDPDKMYQFISKLKKDKTKELLNISRKHRVSPNEALNIFLSISKSQNIQQAKLVS